MGAGERIKNSPPVGDCFFTVCLSGGGKQGGTVVGQGSVQHLRQQRVQRVADGGAAQAQRQHVPSVHRQIPQGEARLLCQQGVQYRLRSVELRQAAAIGRVLGQIVRPLYRQQAAERVLPQLVDGPAMALSVRGMSRSCHCTSVTISWAVRLSIRRRRQSSSASDADTLGWP